jgi:isopenicillin-N epimerase
MNQSIQPPTIATDERNFFGAGAREQWLLDPDCAFLNHGSFGATPRSVLAEQDEWRRRMERQPVHFLVTEAPAAIRTAAEDLATFLGARGEDLAFVDNATTGANAVLRSIAWQPGDEILYTNHGYGAVNKAIEYVCGRTGARPVEARIPFPIEHEDEVVEAVRAALTSKTRLVVIDHVTSPTALVLPVKRVVELCQANGTDVLVDGAHAPGMLPLDLEELGATYYTGNCHKWLMAPKGCAFLWARGEAKRELHPTVISWGWPNGFTEEFDWTGTRDPSAWLSIGAALAFYHQVSPRRRREHNDGLAAWAAAMLEEGWRVAPVTPRHMRGSMATMRLPVALPGTKDEGKRVHDALWHNHRVEVPLIDFAGGLYIRVSAQAYNTPADYERLLDAVRAELL